MAKSYRATTSNISRQMAKLRADIPDTMSGFSAMARAATRPERWTPKPRSSSHLRWASLHIVMAASDFTCRL